MRNKPQAARRGRPLILLITTIVSLFVATAPLSVPTFANYAHDQKIDSLEYKQEHGKWDLVELPKEFRLNAIHGALLPTGKVLLVAGSGNNQTNFDSYHNDGEIKVLKTILFDPRDNSIKTIPTPADFFCGGHALLHSGNLLVAGGTSGYEVLESKVKKPAGAMTVHNENPDDTVRMFKKGTKFVGPTGKEYLATNDFEVKPAEKMDHGNGNVMIMHSSVTVFVEAVREDTNYTTSTNDHYDITGLNSVDKENIYGQGGPMTLKKQDFRGDNKSYEFDPEKEVYIKTGDMNMSRWYPTLSVLTNGNVIATSGLDNAGNITQTTEQYDTASKSWQFGPDREFATYPALFRTKNPDVLFYSGSNAGYGPADKGRTPGFWNYKDNTFSPVGGLRQQNIMETSGSVALPPKYGSNDGSQSDKIMVAGGGGIGESQLVTARTDIIDLSASDPHYTPGPDLPKALRYLNLTVTPWDEIIASGGSGDYRAKENSYSYSTFSVNPTNNTITGLADELVGRSYHSGTILLPDGRILAFGNDPLYSDKDNTVRGTFEQRLELFTAPQFFKGSRPDLNGADNQHVNRGQEIEFTTHSQTIKTARLIPPSSTTHVTNIEQRSVAAVVTSANGKLTVNIPDDENLLPNGWYMLFVTNDQGIPSLAKMIQVVN